MITIVDFDTQAKSLQVRENVNWHEFHAEAGHLYWWDMITPTDDEKLVLSEHFHFHPLAIADCVGDIHYPKVDFYDTYLYMVIHSVDVDRSKVEGFAPKEIDIFLGKDYLVTFHKQETRSVVEVLRRSKEKTPIFEFGLDFVLYSILDILVSNYLPILESIEDELDSTEEMVFSNPTPQVLREILRLKRTLMRLKKTVFPQREVINHLARNEYQFVNPRTQVYFRDVYDMLYRMAEMTESFRDVSTALVETYLSTVSNKMNEIMKFLTIFATIFGPLTVIAGIYGMNFEFMPELHWKHGYLFAIGLMALSTVSLLLYFRHRKWL